MKRIITTDIVDPGILQPITGPSMDFWQDATKEQLANIVQSLIGNTVSTTIPYALWGCVKTSLGGGNFAYTIGAIYFNGEIYDFPAIASINIATADICTVTITNDPTADPLTFTDTIPRSVHNNRDIVLSDGTLGTGTFDFQDIVFINDPWHNIGATGEPAFENSWVNAATGTENPAGFKMDIGGNVSIRGSVKTGATGTTVFTLPVGHRPLNRNRFASPVDTSTDTVYVEIRPTGEVKIFFTGVEVIWWMDGMTFSIR